MSYASVIPSRSTRRAVRRLIQAAQIYAAWGVGSPTWDATPSSPGSLDNALVAEVGRRQLQVIEFCVPDANGDILLPYYDPNNPSGRWSLTTDTSAHHLYIKSILWPSDAPEATELREIGLFMHCQPAAGLPANQTFFLPSDLADAGDAVLITRVTKITRTPGYPQVFETVVDNFYV